MALERTVSSVFDLIENTYRSGERELRLVESQEVYANPGCSSPPNACAEPAAGAAPRGRGAGPQENSGERFSTHTSWPTLTMRAATTTRNTVRMNRVPCEIAIRDPR